MKTEILDNPVYVFTVENKNERELPYAGGEGSLPYLLGAVLIAASLSVYLAYIKKKRTINKKKSVQ